MTRLTVAVSRPVRSRRSLRLLVAGGVIRRRRVGSSTPAPVALTVDFVFPAAAVGALGRCASHNYSSSTGYAYQRIDVAGRV